MIDMEMDNYQLRKQLEGKPDLQRQELLEIKALLRDLEQSDEADEEQIQKLMYWEKVLMKKIYPVTVTDEEVEQLRQVQQEEDPDDQT